MRSWLTATALAIALTGCATAHATTTAAARPAPGPGPQGKALALARHLVAELRLPPGTKPAHLSPLPPDLRDPQAPPGPGWAGATRILAAPGNAVAVLNALLTHAPFNESSGSTQIVPVTVSTLQASPEPGVDAAMVDVSVMQYSRTTTLLAVRAFAAWLPVRTAAEHVDPASIRTVTITEVYNIPAHRQVTRTFVSRAVIGELATLLNNLKPAPELALPCPMPVATPTLKFTPENKNGRAVVVSVSGCGIDYVTVNGASQPSLWDQDGRLPALTRTSIGS